jgi:hypothetical protein
MAAATYLPGRAINVGDVLSDVPDKDVCTGFHFLEWSVGLTY